MGKNICCFTNDVETTSIVNGGLREDTALKVWKEGLPILLDLYSKCNIKTTFFYVAHFAERYPDIVRMVRSEGHEIALHGLTHEHTQAFDTMSLEKQKEHLSTGKKILEDISGEEVVSFRAPALRVNKFTPTALMETGFRYDSSVAPQRIDMFMSLGSKNKLQWLGAPRLPYYTKSDNLARKGDSFIIEVPVSSTAFPYIGTFMRISPAIIRLVRSLLYWETNDKGKIINFLIHPNEVITEEDLHLKTERRAGNYISYLLSDVLRRKLKQRNLGRKCLILYEKEIQYWKDKGYMFARVKDVEIVM